jgi:hypothetical protein
MRIRVRKWAETIVVFLAGRIPKRELHVFTINLDIGNVVLEHSRDVDLHTRT